MEGAPQETPTDKRKPAPASPAPVDVFPHLITDVENDRLYERVGIVGWGGSCRCYKVKDVISDEYFACKIIEKKKLGLFRGLDKARIDEEIRIHQALDHEHIVKLTFHMEDEDFIYIFTELCENRDLKHVTGGRPVAETKIRYILRQISSALHVIHVDHGVIHRDIKPKNIFVGKDMNFKIGDFGSAVGNDAVGDLRTNFQYTISYASPEVLLKKGHSFPCDIWSLGVCLFELAAGELPFEANGQYFLLKKICAGKFKLPTRTSVSLEMSTLIDRMLDLDPSKRPTANDILNDPIFTNCYVPEVLSPRPHHSKDPPPKEKDVNNNQPN